MMKYAFEPNLTCLILELTLRKRKGHVVSRFCPKDFRVSPTRAIVFPRSLSPMISGVVS